MKSKIFLFGVLFAIIIFSMMILPSAIEGFREGHGAGGGGGGGGGHGGGHSGGGGFNGGGIHGGGWGGRGWGGRGWIWGGNGGGNGWGWGDWGGYWPYWQYPSTTVVYRPKKPNPASQSFMFVFMGLIVVLLLGILMKLMK